MGIMKKSGWKKRILSLLVTGCMACSLFSLAGCGAPGEYTGYAGYGAARTEALGQMEDALALEVKLKDVFAEHGMKVGTCLSTEMTENQYISEMLAKQYNSITMENAMKPDYVLDEDLSTSSGELMVSFNADMTEMLDWAKANQMAVRGHTLIWHSQTPEWIFHEGFKPGNAYVSRDVMLERMESFIKQMFEKLESAGYIDLFYAYDVVNEAWMEDGSMRKEDNLWREIIGDDYLWYAFYYANKYAPESIDLYYNDYNEQYKADTLMEFVDTLRDENGNLMIDGIGLQAHLFTSDDLENYFEAVDQLSELGLKMEITELDAGLGAYQNYLAVSDENLKMQGRYIYDLVNGIFERVDNGSLQMDALTFWGFCDRLSWRREASPLLFDLEGKPKYAFYGAAQMKEKSGF